MKKNIIALSLTLFISACGPSGNDGSSATSNDISDDSAPIVDEQTAINYSTITLQRGPVMFSHVEDSAGQVAMNYGQSNKYIFANTPILPITARGGYIDTNANNYIDKNDTILNVSLSSYSNIISPITTIIENNDTILQELMQKYGFSQTELLQEIPSESSPMMIILNNAFYKSLYKNYQYNSIEFLQTIEEINTSYENNTSLTSIEDLKLLATTLETKLLEELNVTKVSEQNLVDINATLQKQNLEIVKNNFTRDVKTSDSVDTIWNILIPIDSDQNLSNLSFGIHIEKVSSGAIGNIIISGASLDNLQLSDATSVTIFGEKSDGTTGSISYDETKPITQGAIKLFSNKLLLNLGYLISQQQVVSQSSFTSASTYKITIYSDKLDINGTIENNENNLRVSYSNYFSFDAGSNLLSGEIIVE